MLTKANNEKHDLRIVFMGTPDFAVESLAAICKAEHDVVGVITAPDRPAGRGRKIQFSAVKIYALDHALHLMQPTNLKDEKFLKELEELKANVQVVVAFRMLPKQVWSMPKYGTFNLHASLLPNYRGAAPINWAIINGEETTGVTTFFIDEKIDTGEIILQEKTVIDKHQTAGELHDILMLEGANLVLRTLNLIAKGVANPIPQKEVKSLKIAPKIHRETCKIDWNKDLDTIYNHIRGLSPYPTAWTKLHDNEQTLLLKVYEVDKKFILHQYETGLVIINKSFMKIAVKNGFLELKKIQLEGKKAMKVHELLNGLKLSKNAFVR